MTSPDSLRPLRRPTVSVDVGGVLVGSAHPVVVQSMTNTDTADPDGTALQVARLAHAGSQLVRVTVNTDEAAAAVPEMIRKLHDNLGVDVPVIGDFHYNGHKLLVDHPEMASALAKYRINPGNVGTKYHDENFTTIVRAAVEHDKPVRIGVNWGSLDQQLLTDLMDGQREGRRAARGPGCDDRRDDRVGDALRGAGRGDRSAARPDHPVGQGLRGAGPRGHVSPARAAVGLPAPPRPDRGRHGHEGDRHLHRRSRDPAQRGDRRHDPGLAHPEPGAGRELEVEVAQQVLQSMGLRSFLPQVSACPGCGRTTSTFFQEMARDITEHIKVRMPEWRETHPGVEELKVAVMGCVVNGPGESKHADIGISLPGTFEAPVAPVFVDGKLDRTLRGDRIVDEFIELLESYVDRRYGRTGVRAEGASDGLHPTVAPGCRLSTPARPACSRSRRRGCRGPRSCPRRRGW